MFQTSSRIGINITSPTYSLDVSGSTRVSSDLIFQSQLRNNTGNFGIVSPILVRTTSTTAHAATFSKGGFGDLNTLQFASNDGTQRFSLGQGRIGNESSTDLTLARFASSTWSDVFRIFNATGNISINSSTDAGFRLDVAGTTRFVGNSLISGSLNVTSAITASQALISGSGTQRLIVVGSGSAQPRFTVQGSQGELFSITDSLSGSLFSVNDISGLPILETFSDSTTLLGSYLAPALFTTVRTTTTNSGSFVIYNIPTGSYDGLYVDYTARSGSNARAGQIMAIWSGSSVNFTETTTTDFGTTSNLLLGVSISGSNMAFTGSVATGSGWVIKSIIRSI
jgi:hypothetical protein